MKHISEDLTGKRFGRWLVLERKGSKIYASPSGKTYFPLYLCRCDCGVEAIVTGNNLKSGRSQSCGCLRDELARARLRKKKV